MNVNTVWGGPVEIPRQRITKKTIHAFRNGGCAALASALYGMIPGTELYVWGHGPLEGHNLAAAWWSHMGVLLPEGDTLDVGGLNPEDTWDNSYEYTTTFVDDEMLYGMVDMCPPQDPEAVLVTATNLVRRLNISHQQILTYVGEGAGTW